VIALADIRGLFQIGYATFSVVVVVLWWIGTRP
jgi:hypothetical protein